MKAALDPTKGYQCIIPKSFSTRAIVQTRHLDHKPDCSSKCDSNKTGVGKCSYCGPKGYCCQSRKV